MSIAVQTFPVLPTRLYSFCLCLQGGSAFADFDTDDADIISPRRISCDGKGSCEAESGPKMSSGDSRLLRDAIARSELESVQVGEVLRRYIRKSMNVIWNDALAEPDLLWPMTTQQRIHALLRNRPSRYRCDRGVSRAGSRRLGR